MEKLLSQYDPSYSRVMIYVLNDRDDLPVEALTGQGIFLD
jgi:hypothetical protein